MRLLGVLALVCYAIHGGAHLLKNQPEDLLWACHIGAALVGVGLLAGSARLNGIGVLFLILGTPLWIMDLLAGGEFLPTSCFTHLGGLAIGLVGVRRLGMPRSAWWQASAALVALIFLCRLITPREANVNVAFDIQRGWEKYFPSHAVYLVTMIGQATVYFFIVGYVLRRWLTRQHKLA
jgi:hypothetical protein